MAWRPDRTGPPGQSRLRGDRGSLGRRLVSEVSSSPDNAQGPSLSLTGQCPAVNWWGVNFNGWLVVSRSWIMVDRWEWPTRWMVNDVERWLNDGQMMVKWWLNDLNIWLVYTTQPNNRHVSSPIKTIPLHSIDFWHTVFTRGTGFISYPWISTSRRLSLT